MNKIKATRKEMANNSYVIQIGYCKLQHLLNGSSYSAIAFSANNYGWACDYYLIDNVIISTGYAPIVSINTYATYEMIKEYDDLASKMTYTSTKLYEKYDDKTLAFDNLLEQFVRVAKINPKTVKANG